MQRELVIDIDISDYDELRTCGSGGHICTKCWPFMAVAIQVGGGVGRYRASHAGIGTVLPPLRVCVCVEGGGACRTTRKNTRIWVAVVTGSRSTALRQPS